MNQDAQNFFLSKRVFDRDAVARTDGGDSAARRRTGDDPVVWERNRIVVVIPQLQVAKDCVSRAQPRTVWNIVNFQRHVSPIEMPILKVRRTVQIHVKHGGRVGKFRRHAGGCVAGLVCKRLQQRPGINAKQRRRRHCDICWTARPRLRVPGGCCLPLNKHSRLNREQINNTSKHTVAVRQNRLQNHPIRTRASNSVGVLQPQKIKQRLPKIVLWQRRDQIVARKASPSLRSQASSV
jgi:hypothetical protein